MVEVVVVQRWSCRMLNVLAWDGAGDGQDGGSGVIMHAWSNNFCRLAPLVMIMVIIVLLLPGG